MNTDKIRNIAIIAHVDHGKTTLVDKLLKQSGTLQRGDMDRELIMDSNDQERERGITILAKNTAIEWEGYHINIVDTPGHADFGGEVERVLSMVDSVLLLVDAVDGPMPQTRFVTQKAFEQGLHPIVIVNKIDRPSARPDWVIDQVFDLFDHLGATDEQLDFPIIYTSALQGIAGMEIDNMAEDMTPLLRHIVDDVQPPDVNTAGPLQMQISALDYSSYVGVIGLGRITRGVVKPGQRVTAVSNDGTEKKGKILKVMGHLGLQRIEVDEAFAGDIVCVVGLEGLQISDTVCDPEHVEPLKPLTVDEPTISMTFQVNNGPFSGRDGKFLTSRHIRERLERELIHNVALRVEQTDSSDSYKVSGRGGLHLSVLIETMRREGFELCIGRPHIIKKEIDGVLQEPIEDLLLNIDSQHQGAVMEELGKRKAELQNMSPDTEGRLRLEFHIPARGLLGFRNVFMTLTSGSGVMTHSFSHYGVVKKDDFARRTNGVLVSMVNGTALAYALYNLEERGTLFIGPGTDVYEGMIVGMNSRTQDMTVNPTKGKKLTNVRASSADDAIQLTPHTQFTLEQAIEFIDDDELVEVTPSAIRLRKVHLKENERKLAEKRRTTE